MNKIRNNDSFLVLAGALLFHSYVTCKQVLVEMSYVYNNKTVSPPDPTMWKYELQNVHKGPWENHDDVW